MMILPCPGQVNSEGEKHIKTMGQALKSADHLYLATDPDREGEAISWHIYQELNRRKLLKDVDVNRVVFHEITPEAIQQAMEKPRALNQDLIDAYLARRGSRLPGWIYLITGFVAQTARKPFSRTGAIGLPAPDL